MFWIGGVLADASRQGTEDFYSREKERRAERREQERYERERQDQEADRIRAKREKDAELNRTLNEGTRRLMADQYGLSRGLEGPEAEELSTLRPQRGGLGAAAEGNQPFTQWGQTPMYAPWEQQPTQAPRMTPQQLEMTEARAKMDRLKFLEQREQEARLGPVRTVRDAEEISHYARKHYPPSGPAGLSYDQRMNLNTHQTDNKIRAEDSKQGHITGRHSENLEQRDRHHDENLAQKYAAMRQAWEVSQSTRNADEARKALETIVDDYEKVNSQLVGIVTSDPITYDDPYTVAELKRLRELQQQTRPFYERAREQLQQRGGSAPVEETRTSVSGSAPRGNAPPLPIRGEVREPESNGRVFQGKVTEKEAAKDIGPKAAKDLSSSKIPKEYKKQQPVKGKEQKPRADVPKPKQKLKGIDETSYNWAVENLDKHPRAREILLILQRKGLLQ